MHDARNDDSSPSLPLHEALEYSEVTVDTTEHLNELNRQEDWEAEYSQLDTGPFQSRFLVREYDDLLAAKEAYNTRVEIKCTPPAGMVAVMVSLPGERPTEANGHSLWGTRASRLSGRAVIPVSCVSGPTGGTSSISMSERFRNPTGSFFRAPPPFLKRALTYTDAHRVELDALRRFMDDLVFNPSGRFDSPERADAFKRMVLDAMVTAGDWPTSGARTSLATRRHVTMLACGYIEDHYDEPVTTEALCRHTVTSARTLQRAFLEHFEMTPTTYLKICRLNTVHGGLGRTEKGEHTIAELAMKHGFNHLGRSSTAYKQLFHESPRKTLGRAT